MKKGDTPEKLNVVILEDDPTYLRVWEKIFSNIPECHYYLTNDPHAAINMIKSQKIDMVISEIVLSTTDGYSIADLAKKRHPKANIILTTTYDCDLTRFNLKNPNFSILYKPYNNINDIQKFIKHLLYNEDVFSDASEDSFSENDVFPDVMEWKL